MTVATEVEYGQLLREVLPRVIHTKKEHARQLAEVERLMVKADRTPAETVLLEALATFVHDYEKKTFPPREKSTPAEMLAFLMEQNGLKPADLPIPHSRVSEILSGKRSVSKAQAIVLAERFQVSPALFLDKAQVVK